MYRKCIVIRLYGLYMHICFVTYIYIRTHSYITTCVYSSIHMHTSSYTYTLIDTYIHVYVCVCIHICLHTYIYIYVYMYMCIYRVYVYLHVPVCVQIFTCDTHGGTNPNCPDPTCTDIKNKKHQHEPKYTNKQKETMPRNTRC